MIHLQYYIQKRAEEILLFLFDNKSKFLEES